MTPGVAIVTGLLFALANAAHCAGMCGGFAVSAASPPFRGGGFVLYGAGKAFTYLFFGTLAGAFGAGVLRAGGNAQSVLGIAAAAVLIVAGIARLRGASPRAAGGGALAGFLQPLLARVGRADSGYARFSLGALTAALPCGVVYFAALQAAAAGTRAGAVALMAGFAVGTMPVLGVVALVTSGIRGRVSAGAARYASAAVVVLLGAIALWRALMPLMTAEGVPRCCH